MAKRSQVEKKAPKGGRAFPVLFVGALGGL